MASLQAWLRESARLATTALPNTPYLYGLRRAERVSNLLFRSATIAELAMGFSASVGPLLAFLGSSGVVVPFCRTAMLRKSGSRMGTPGSDTVLTVRSSWQCRVRAAQRVRTAATEQN